MSRWIAPLIALLIGIAFGLAYGWVLDPVQYVDTTPETLRPDYRADYVLMVAEAYQADQDPGLAVQRLAILGSQDAASIAGQALTDARQYGFAESDLILLQKLKTAVQAWQPASGRTAP
ncbi:MAG: hypothetical protein ACM3QS_00090 [Bacteroidota bacterium]